MARILIIEDNQVSRYSLVDFLEMKGYETDNTDDGLKALALLSLEHFDLAVLDIMIPGINGIDLCKELRSRGNDIPILVLSPRDTVQDRVEGLAAGADDYLVKPFALPELALRISAILRRTGPKAPHTIKAASIVMDLDDMTVTRSGKPVKLNPMTFKVLKILMLKSPSIVSREAIEHALWGDSPPDSDSLRTHIHNLRAAIDTPFDSPLIKTISGFGWALRDN